MGNQPKLKVEYMSTDALVPYVNNAKKHPEWQVEQIAESIKQFGNCDPIAVWTNDDGLCEVVEGHGRLMALKTLGVEICPVITLDHLDDDARRAYAHIHNQLTMNTEFDSDALEAEIDRLSSFDWESFGFEHVSIDGFGTDFSLTEQDMPTYKTVSLQLSAEQFAVIDGIISSFDISECKLVDGNKSGNVVCEVMRQWEEQRI